MVIINAMTETISIVKKIRIKLLRVRVGSNLLIYAAEPVLDLFIR